jgi:hypothetical protein
MTHKRAESRFREEGMPQNPDSIQIWETQADLNSGLYAKKTTDKWMTIR